MFACFGQGSVSASAVMRTKDVVVRSVPISTLSHPYFRRSLCNADLERRLRFRRESFQEPILPTCNFAAKKIFY